MTIDHLSALLEERDTTALRLAELDREIATASRAYWSGKGYTVIPRPEAIRREVAAHG